MINHNWNGRYLKFIFLFVLFHAGNLSAQDNIISNTELLHQVLTKSVTRITEELPRGAEIMLVVQYPEYDWFVRHRLIEIFNTMGFSVVSAESQNNGSYIAVELGVEEFGINYSDVKRGSIFGSRKMTRKANGEFSVRIKNIDVERVFRITDSITDVVPYGRRDEIENRAFPFTQGALPEGAFIDRYLGPAVIIAATGLVVYLFFSVRS